MAKRGRGRTEGKVLSGDSGWTADDFKFSYPQRDPSITPQAFGIAPVQPQTALTVGMPGMAQSSTTPMPISRQVNAATANVPQQDIGRPPSTLQEQFSIPADRAAVVKDYFDNPTQLRIPSTIEITKTWLSQIFDFEDTFNPANETPDNPSGYTPAETGVESVWDGFLRGLKWGYDRVGQAGTYGVSAAPGGIPTLSWNQANDVSWAQAGIAAGAANVRNLGPVAGQVANLATSPVALLGGSLTQGDMVPGLNQPNFDVTNPQMRQQAFVESEVGKWSSGLIDAGFVIFADPLIIGGKALKLGRLRYLDRLIDSPQRVAEIGGELARGAEVVNRVRSTTPVGEMGASGADIDKFRDLPAIAQFAAWVTQKTPEGKKIIDRGAITRHRAIRWATNRDGLTSALYNAENYDEAAAILGVAAGDPNAMATLMSVRADLAVELGDAQRQLNWLQMVADPKSRAKVIKSADEQVKILQDRVNKMRRDGMKDTAVFQRERLRLDQAIETRQYARNFDIRKVDPLDPMVPKSPEAIEVARKAVQEMMQRDKFFAEGLATENKRMQQLKGSLMSRTAGFSSDTMIGRLAERSRQSRAVSAFEAASTRGAKVIDASGKERSLFLRPWQKDVYGNNGLTRTLNLWRWAWEESPSGAITTTGIGSQESSREVMAMMNDVYVYSGPAKTVTIPKTFRDAKGELQIAVDKQGNQVMETITVGGARRKEELVGLYMDALQNTARGDAAARAAFAQVEEQMFKDIAAWHGMDQVTAEALFNRTRTKRDELVQSIRDEGYWVEDKEIHKAPWLDTHLQNGTYSINFRAFEKKASQWEQEGWAKNLTTARDYATEKLSGAYEFFDEIWRPSVLLRLGYTQRNVTEGLFRAAAFTFSLDPIGDAVAAGALSTRNAWVRASRRPALKQAELAMKEAEATGILPDLPKKFQRWRAKQVVAREQDINNHLMTLQRIGLLMASDSRAFHAEQVAFWKAEKADAATRIAALRKAGAPQESIDIAAGYGKFADDTLTTLKGIKPVDRPTPDLDDVMDDWKVMQQYLDHSRLQREILDDDLKTVALFRQQGLAKRRPFDGQSSGPDHTTWRAAFHPDSPFTPIAMMLASADNTNKAQIMMRMSTINKALNATRTRYFVNVNPGDPTYFDSLATVIRQFKYSDVGRMVVEGRPVGEIVKWMHSTPEGKDLAQFLMKASEGVTRGPKISLLNKRESAEYVRMLYDRWQVIAPTQQIRDYVRATDLGTFEAGKAGWNGRVVEDLIGQKDASGRFVNQLKPVVGNVVEELGFGSVREVIRSVSSTGMRLLGTIPEDTLVRLPFYGRRYEESMQQMTRIALAQKDTKYISIREINQMMEIAHRRALKDTKDTLYTIDRRTKLGTYAEWLFPFISASQNSITTVGRLIYNDPAVLPIMANIWRAPQVAGIEDENGNIVIPFFKNLIPERMQKELGIENLLEMKISKAGLNTILPESGFLFLPRPGLLFAAPYGEFMKAGLFGQHPDPPGIFVKYLGEDAAKSVWTVWKNWVFGERQGPSTQTLSWDEFIPPAGQKLLQIWMGNSSREYSYMYNTMRNIELGKIWSGERDAPTDLDAFATEITDKVNGYQMLRFLGNILAFTPPRYTTELDPLIEAVRFYDRTYGLDGARMGLENLGPELLMLGDFSNTKNIAGMPPVEEAVANARRYESLMKRIAPTLKQTGDLTLLSMLVNRTPGSYMDASSYAWQLTNQVPGVTDYFRELQTPEMSLLDSQRNTGWTEWIARKSVIDSLLQQAGFTSYSQAGAAKYKEMLNATKADMIANPMYSAWYADFRDFGNTRTDNAIRLMETALSDPTFVNDNFSDDDTVNTMWEGAWYYLKIRKMVVEGVRQSGLPTINSPGNERIREFWDQQRQALINQVEGWGLFANRWLNGDDDPVNTGVQLGVMYEQGGGVASVGSAG